jgi:hypothetical protein
LLSCKPTVSPNPTIRGRKYPLREEVRLLPCPETVYISLPQELDKANPIPFSPTTPSTPHVKSPRSDLGPLPVNLDPRQILPQRKSAIDKPYVSLRTHVLASGHRLTVGLSQDWNDPAGGGCRPSTMTGSRYIYPDDGQLKLIPLFSLFGNLVGNFFNGSRPHGSGIRKRWWLKNNGGRRTLGARQNRWFSQDD